MAGRTKLYLERSSAGSTVVDDKAPCRNDTVVAAESGGRSKDVNNFFKQLQFYLIIYIQYVQIK